ncbi:MAG: hypothetical protein ACJ0HU_03425 [Gammaproteobacteria bacterium]
MKKKKYDFEKYLKELSQDQWIQGKLINKQNKSESNENKLG